MARINLCGLLLIQLRLCTRWGNLSMGLKGRNCWVRGKERVSDVVSLFSIGKGWMEGWCERKDTFRTLRERWRIGHCASISSTISKFLEGGASPSSHLNFAEKRSKVHIHIQEKVFQLLTKRFDYFWNYLSLHNIYNSVILSPYGIQMDLDQISSVTTEHYSSPFQILLRQIGVYRTSATPWSRCPCFTNHFQSFMDGETRDTNITYRTIIPAIHSY